MKKIKIIFYLCFMGLFWPYEVLGLKESDSSTRYALLKKPHFYHIEEFKGAKNLTLRLARFGQGVGAKGTLIFINGWAENLLKYIELFYDLNLKGFSPIYTYDHRGQGFSDRPLLDHPHISYVQDYALYAKDMESFIDRVLKDPEVRPDKLFLIAHSMGGHIAINYVQEKRDRVPFKAMVLSAPMLQIQALPSFLEGLALTLIKGICFFSCGWSIPGIDPQNSSKEKLTSSQERIAFAQHVEKKVPYPPLSQLSAKWVLSSVASTDRIMKKKRVQNITIPILILQAEEEVLVSNSQQNQFCQALPHLCQIKTFKGRHELFLESDKVREEAIQDSITFFLSSLSK